MTSDCTENLEREGNKIMVVISEEAKESIRHFKQHWKTFKKFFELPKFLHRKCIIMEMQN